MEVSTHWRLKTILIRGLQSAQIHACDAQSLDGKSVSILCGCLTLGSEFPSPPQVIKMSLQSATTFLFRPSHMITETFPVYIEHFG